MLIDTSKYDKLELDSVVFFNFNSEGYMFIIYPSKLRLLRVSKSSIYLTVSLNCLAIHKFSCPSSIFSYMNIHNENGTDLPTEAHSLFPWGYQ